MAGPAPITVESVYVALAAVMDPELDEPVTEMGFVEEIEVRGSEVRIAFRLPTYWCSPNFAFLMVEDVHAAVAALPGVDRVEVGLLDHLHGEEIVAAVREGRSFGEALGEAAGDVTLTELRRTFEDKAFQRRQEAVLLDLKSQGFDDDGIVTMCLSVFDHLDFVGAEARRRAPLYRALLVERGFVRSGGDRVFVMPDGTPIAAENLWAHLGQLRRVRINMEFSGALCRGLKEHRYKEAVREDGELTLVDFLPGSSASRTENAPRDNARQRPVQGG